MKQIVLIDDNPADVKLMQIWFAQQNGYKITHVFLNGLEAIRHAHASQPNIYLIDMQMPLLSGVETLVLLRNKGFNGAVMAVSHSYSNTNKLLLQQNGANGYCQKKKEAVLNGLLQIEKHGNYFNEDFFNNWQNISLKNKLHTYDEDPRLKLLNPNYKKILKYTYFGFTTQQIAEKMQLKKHTVEQYRASMLQNLGFLNMCQATSWAILYNVFNISELPPPRPQRTKRKLQYSDQT